MSLAVLAYIDRTVIAQAAPLISADLGFDKVMMGTVLSAFLLGYGLFEIPGGWYGDWVGARKGLMRIVAGAGRRSPRSPARRGTSRRWS